MKRWTSPKSSDIITDQGDLNKSEKKRTASSAVKPRLPSRLNPKMSFAFSPAREQTTRFLSSLESNRSVVKKKKKTNSKTPKTNRREITLPPKDRPNFVRKGASELVINADFDDRWESFLETKKLGDAVSRIYQYVYFKKWKARFANSYCDRLEKRNLQMTESVIQAEKEGQQSSKTEIQVLDTMNLIRLARSKIDELSQDTFQRKPTSKEHPLSTWSFEPRSGENNVEESNRRELTPRVRKWHSIQDPSYSRQPSKTRTQVDDTSDECQLEDLDITEITTPQKTAPKQPPKPSDLHLSQDAVTHEQPFDSEATFMSDGEDLRNEATKILSSYTAKQPSKSSMNQSLLSMSYSRTPQARQKSRTSIADSFNAGPQLTEQEEMINKRLGRRYKDLSCYIPSTQSAMYAASRRFATESFEVRGGTYKEAQTETHFTTTDEESESLGPEFNIVFSSEASNI